MGFKRNFWRSAWERIGTDVHQLWFHKGTSVTMFRALITSLVPTCRDRNPRIPIEFRTHDNVHSGTHKVHESSIVFENLAETEIEWPT